MRCNRAEPAVRFRAQAREWAVERLPRGWRLNYSDGSVGKAQPPPLGSASRA